MQLDKTHVAIRERGFLDILELALKLVRAHETSLALLFLCCCLPLLLFNYWLLSGMDLETYDDGQLLSYLLLLFGLVVFEAPLVVAPITLYLGQVIFSEQADLKRVAADYYRSLPQLLLFQFLLRGLVCVICLAPVSLYYLGAPYLSEIILLERNPTGGTFSRSTALHTQAGSLIFGRWLTSMTIGLMLTFCFWQTISFLRSTLAGSNYWSTTSLTVDLPLALWLVFAFFAVARFLSYLDLRIRREGWEIELKMRAEAARLATQLT